MDIDKAFKEFVEEEMNIEAAFVEEFGLDERKMTDAEMAEREEIVKKLKPKLQSFKDRYGDDAKKVMYATATKQAMEEVEIDEKWKKGNYTVKDQDGKILGKFKSGAKAQKFVDKIWDEGDYDSLTVELGEEVVYTRGVELDEKWEVGVVYHQDFGGGEISYFRADSLLKNRRWKGMAVDEYSGKQKKPRNITADEKTPGWKITPKDKIPKGLKEEVEIEEASKLPPHLAKFFDKDGNLKKDAAARVAKGRAKLNWKDVTPKGYGPKEEVDEKLDMKKAGYAGTRHKDIERDKYNKKRKGQGMKDEVEEGVTGPTRMDVQKHFDKEKGLLRVRINATEKALKISDMKVDAKGTVQSFKEEVVTLGDQLDQIE